ncbi:MAG: hypothetical protein MPJ52_05360, partial [Alphaproteobacteria bacterium]|nr:hypothetical protein [Alphaproteobacteria bacterium]
MFNLLVSSVGWTGNQSRFDGLRVLRRGEYTDPAIVAKYEPERKAGFPSLKNFPCLFMKESGFDEGEAGLARVGTINQIQPLGDYLLLDYTFDHAIPPFTNGQIKEFASQIGILDDFEFYRTHWAVKD